MEFRKEVNTLSGPAAVPSRSPERGARPLEPLDAPLTGMHLIEASAGTGKTYAIASLYLRLVVEAKLEPAQILVVTFTEAATKELSHRIRQRLADAIAVLEGAAAGDPFLRGMAERLAAGGVRHEALVRLRLALSSMDLAAIHTIHGFCRRMLQEHAFESGALFETEFVTDETEILADVVHDFWRGHAPSFGPAFTGYLYEAGVSADSLALLMAETLRALCAAGEESLRLPVIPETPAEEGALLAELRGLWPEGREALLGLLAGKGLSNAKDKLSPAFRERLARALDAWTRGPVDSIPPLAPLERITPAALEAATLKRPRGETPRHRFFDCVGQLLDLCRAAHSRLTLDLLAFCRVELPERKRRARILSFQDLILSMRERLDHEEGVWLVQAVRARFRAALIDEFQDTDPLQNRIFQTLFRHPGAGLFLIGDPKQAIYGFRGADIFAYLQAGRAVSGENFTLSVNWRSSPAFVRAVNLLFSGHPRPFLLAGIEYRPVAPAERAMERLEIPGNTAALIFRCFPSGGTRPRTRRMVAAHAAREIAELLRAGETGGARFIAPDGTVTPLQARHIAVLVRANAEGELVRRQLAARGIRAIFHAGESVFASVEAEELGWLLEAVLAPADPRKVRAVLASRLLGRTAAELAAAESDQALLEDFSARLAAWRDVWLVRGFAVMLGRVLAEERVFERLAGLSGGERAITNLRHLGELLREAAAGGLTPEELPRHFRTRRQDAERAADEELLRLESDENLVRILTIHRSKGLEFACVFCPFLWDGREGGQREREVLVCHGGDGEVIVDLGSAEREAHRVRAAEESFAEELRLLYVAVTRARHRAVIHWGAAFGRGGSTASSSPLGWLFFPPGGNEAAGEGRLIPKENAGLRLPAEQLAAASGGVIAALSLAPEEEAVEAPLAAGRVLARAAREYPRLPAAEHVIWSFTALQHGVEAGVSESPDHDRTAVPAEDPGQEREERSIFTFPRGSRAGSCIHAILEELDFPAAVGAALDDSVTRHLARFGFDSGWHEVLAGAVGDMLDTPLDTGERPLRLREVEARDRLPELEFYYPVPAAGGRELRGIFGRGAETGPTGGHSFMKGFIDLVFRKGERYYLADYKSNHLGDRQRDYRRERLAVEMRATGYELQARVYTLALHRLLRARLGAGYDYDRHFGGVWYLFLRGMRPSTGPDRGVFFLRPEREEVEAMDAACPGSFLSRRQQGGHS